MQRVREGRRGQHVGREREAGIRKQESESGSRWAESKGPRVAASKILSRAAIKRECARLRPLGLKIVFTNGAFDILHAGHVTYLDFARRQGDVLVVGLNSDASVRRYKGPGRPVNSQKDRALVLASLECVDYVVSFGEDEPARLIGEVLPDVLVKGADWAHYVSGRDIVEKRGGRVVLARMVEGRSTTNVIRAIRKGAKAGRPPPARRRRKP